MLENTPQRVAETPLSEAYANECTDLFSDGFYGFFLYSL